MSKKSVIALIVLIVVAALVAGVLFLCSSSVGEAKRMDGDAPATETKYKFTLEIIHKDGQKKTVSVTTDEEVLGVYLEKEGIIEGAEGPYGMYIAKVEGEKAVYEEDNAYWAFYIDGEYASTGVDQTKIENGKVYQLKYEAAN